MSGTDKALGAQLTSILNRSGKSLDQVYGLIRKSGLSKHGEIRELLKRELHLGHGDANTVAHCYLHAGRSATSGGSDR